MKDILFVNDDGYQSAGYYPLLEELAKQYSVTAVAPRSEKSWVGKSMSAHNAVGYEKLTHNGQEVHVIDGTPADCVQIGIYSLLEKRPDFVVSGINIGENIGHGRILSSGTIGAAMEGAIDGVISIAVSLCDTRDRGIDYFSPESYKYFENAAKIVVKVMRLLEDMELPEGIDVLSINVPFDAQPDADVEITKPYIEPLGQLFNRDGDTFTHVGAPVRYENLKDSTDIKAVHEGKIAITPIDLRLALPEATEFLKQNLKSRWSS
jgi:5'-nucleotidase